MGKQEEGLADYAPPPLPTARHNQGAKSDWVVSPFITHTMRTNRFTLITSLSVCIVVVVVTVYFFPYPIAPRLYSSNAFHLTPNEFETVTFGSGWLVSASDPSRSTNSNYQRSCYLTGMADYVSLQRFRINWLFSPPAYCPKCHDRNCVRDISEEISWRSAFLTLGMLGFLWAVRRLVLPAYLKKSCFKQYFTWFYEALAFIRPTWLSLQERATELDKNVGSESLYAYTFCAPRSFIYVGLRHHWNAFRCEECAIFILA